MKRGAIKRAKNSYTVYVKKPKHRAERMGTMTNSCTKIDNSTILQVLNHLKLLILNSQQEVSSCASSNNGRLSGLPHNARACKWG